MGCLVRGTLYTPVDGLSRRMTIVIVFALLFGCTLADDAVRPHHRGMPVKASHDSRPTPWSAVARMVPYFTGWLVVRTGSYLVGFMHSKSAIFMAVSTCRIWHLTHR